MPPYFALLPVGFAEPGRSPGLLVSSYLTVSPLPGGSLRRAVCFLWHFPYPDEPGGGCYPPPRPVESGLSSAARPGPALRPFRPVPRRSSRLSRPWLYSTETSGRLNHFLSRRASRRPGVRSTRAAHGRQFGAEVVGGEPPAHRVLGHVPGKQEFEEVVRPA